MKGRKGSRRRGGKRMWVSMGKRERESEVSSFILHRRKRTPFRTVVEGSNSEPTEETPPQKKTRKEEAVRLWKERGNDACQQGRGRLDS